MNLLSKKFFSKIFIILSLFIVFSLLATNNTQAACVEDTFCDYKAGEDIFNCKADCLGPGVPTKSIKDAIYDTTDWILGFATAISVLMLIIGGLYYVMSTGNQEQITTAKKIIQYSLYGLIVVGISYALIVVVSTVIT
jgi:hypothetical protein